MRFVYPQHIEVERVCVGEAEYLKAIYLGQFYVNWS